jgi:ribonucleoside-triphosphate reductase (thioredoxin)
MDISQSILSDITVFNKYARYYPELGRRETWDEIVARNMQMHLSKYPALAKEIKSVYKNFVIPKKVLPSMRSMQFGGSPIELSNNRIYNCCYLPADHIDSFSEMMFLLLGGTGVGYSVQTHHVDQIPIVHGVKSKSRRFLVGDSIEGWADAVKVLVEAYFNGKSEPVFDFRDIRPKGARLITSGGKAPGPDPLRICLDQLRSILNKAVGRKLKPIEVHDMMCHIADAVLSGGIRRAALISLFSRFDYDMLSCKSGAWWELNPQRGRANNSAVLPRGDVTEEEFKDIWERVKASGAGEPGIYWTNDIEMGTNPCCEIALKPNQFCNLTEINVSDIVDQDDLIARSKAAAFIGTLQAGYTDFHYLRPIWKETTESEALVGVGQTGIASGAVLNCDLTAAAHAVLAENARVSKLIGVNPCARSTCVKPSGTTSLVVGSSSGIHAWHAEYYIRRMRVGKNEALYSYMVNNFPMLIEDCKFKPHLEAVMSFPQKAPAGAIVRTESYMDLLERVKKFAVEWVLPGHVSGNNTHNVSCTISLKDDEWKPCGDWMWENRNDYNGISVLPFDGGTYVQAPFEDCTEETFNELITHLHSINIKAVKELDDQTSLTDQAACAGGACEVDFG